MKGEKRRCRREGSTGENGSGIEESRMWEIGREREGGKRKTKKKGKELPKEMRRLKKMRGTEREGRGRRIEEITTREIGSDRERGKREARTKGKELNKKESRGDEYRDKNKGSGERRGGRMCK